MKRIKLLYLGLFLVAFFAVVVVLGSLNAPQEQKVAEETKCVASTLGNSPLVNGLGKDVRIPLFPGAKRLTFTDATAVQYVARAYDSEIKGFYDDRLTALCWQIKEQSRDQIVYKNDGLELKLSLLPNPAGKTVIDYVVTTSEGVLGTVRIAQTACTSEQMYCNGSCVPMGTSCSAPTDASSCTGGTVYCPSSYGGSGWCQYGSCPSSTTSTGSTWPTDQATCSSQGYFWCNNACQMTACTTSGGNTSTGAWPMDQASCTSQAKFWCTPSGGGSGWCQSTACGTTSSACPSDQYWCSSSNTCIPNSSSCGPVASGGTNTYTGDVNSCPSFAYSRWDSSNQRYCQLNNEVKCDYNYPSYLTNSSNYTAANCPAGSTNTGGNYSSCPSGQYMCNGSCINNSSSCSSTAWPTDQPNCTSQGKFWCTPSGGGSGWCQSTACTTNYSSSSCPAGQWMCNNACIPTSSNCNGYSYSGTTTTTQTTSCPSGQWLCSGSCISSSATCNGYYSDGTSVTPPSGTTCAAGYKWCASSQSCVNAVQPCYITSQQTTTQTQQTQPTTQPQQQQTTACTAGNYWCASANRCLSSNESCGIGTTQTEDLYQRPVQTYPPGPGDQYGPGQGQWQQGPSEEDIRRQEEQEKRMREQQFRQMKRGMVQFSRGITQMKRFVDRAKARLARQGVGIPVELTNAMAKAPELLAKLKAAKTIEEFEDLMGDMQDIGMIMQEWGPKMGELERLGGMLSRLTREVRNMTTSFKRVKRAAARRPELADTLKEVEAMLGVMGKKAADAKVLAKSDPEGALELVEDFYGNSEEYWNTIAVVDMVANVTRGLSQANSEIRRAETKIRAMQRAKQADAETIATLKEMIAGIKESLPELRAVLARRPVDYEEIKFAAESFWEQIQEFESLLAEQGQGYYAPTVKSGAGIKIDIPEGFLGSPSSDGGGGFGEPGGEGPGGPGGPGGFGPGPGGPGGF